MHNYYMVGILSIFLIAYYTPVSSFADSDDTFSHVNKVGFSVEYPKDWNVHNNTSSTGWGTWESHLMGFSFSSDNANNDGARFYVATIPPMFESTDYDDQSYLDTMVLNEEKFCASKIVDWHDEFSHTSLTIEDPLDSFVCTKFMIVNSTEYSISGQKYYHIQYDWTRNFENGEQVPVSSVRLDIPTKDKTFVLYVEAPQVQWEEDEIHNIVKSFNIITNTDTSGVISSSITLLVLKQHNDGIPVDELTCKNPSLVLAIRDNGKPICASDELIQKIGLDILN